MKKRFVSILQLLCCFPFFLTAQAPDVKRELIERMDREMQTRTQTEDKTYWVNGKELTIEGMAWADDVEDYTRLPERFKSTVTPKVWDLSRHSAGIAIRFTVSNTTFIAAKWTLRSNNYMAHMTPQATNGLDLYVRQNGKWVWTAVGKPAKNGLEQETVLKDKGFFADDTYECMLYLPLYAGVSSVYLGFSENAVVKPAVESRQKPLVFYGTSILQGCSASRAGMPFSSMLGRYFDIPVVNLGFSGNGLMENYFAGILGEVEASAYILDCLPNMWRLSQEEIKARVLTMVRELKRTAPETPIVLVEDRSYTHPDFSGKQPGENHQRKGQMEAYQILKEEVEGLYYVKGELLLAGDTEATVDGSHPSDLGMHYYFIALKPVIKEALGR